MFPHVPGLRSWRSDITRAIFHFWSCNRCCHTASRRVRHASASGPRSVSEGSGGNSGASHTRAKPVSNAAVEKTMIENREDHRLRGR